MRSILGADSICLGVLSGSSAFFKILLVFSSSKDQLWMSPHHELLGGSRDIILLEST